MITGFMPKASNRVSRCPVARDASLLDWSPKATANFCGFVKYFLRFLKKILHKNAEKCEGRKKKKTFDRLYIKGLEFRKDIIMDER